MVTRFKENPIISTKDILPSSSLMNVECVLNPGVFKFENKTWLLLRVAERPQQEEGFVSFPIIGDDENLSILRFELSDPNLDLSDNRMVTYSGKMYLSTLSHLRLVCSDDNINFYEPSEFPTQIFGQGNLEKYGIEDSRVSFFENRYHLTFTQVSDNGVGVGMMTTNDWKEFEKQGMIMPPHNKDCALFEEKINGKYFCLHRPSGIGIGGNYIWLATSPDLSHWGDHKCLLKTRQGKWDSARIGAGASPIKTEKGWIEIYHGADQSNRYCLGAVLLDLNDPSIVLSRLEDPLFEPSEPYELNGFFGNVVFTNGHIIEGDQIVMYYGASDQVICGATISLSKLLSKLLNQ